MKRVFAMALVLGLVIAASGCAKKIVYAHDNLERLQVAAAFDDMERPAMRASQAAGEEQAQGLLGSIPPTEDIVKPLDNGGLDVQSKGVHITMEFPFGWAVLAQDPLAQLNEYMNLVDPVEFVTFMQSGEMTMYGFTSNENAFFFVKIGEDNFSQLIGSLNAISDDKVKDAVAASLQEQYGATTTVSWKKLGDNSVITMRNKDGEGSVLVYEAIVNGKYVDMVYAVHGELTDTDVEAMDFIAEHMTLS